MGRNKKILVNTVLLTLTSLLMRAIGMTFQIYLSNRIGAAGVGLFQLIMSVYTLFVTLAVSGIRYASTRLISEELGLSPSGSVTNVVRKCMIYALTFGTLATVLQLVCAEQISCYWIKDVRAASSLRILSISLPCIAMSAVLSGYFTAVCRVFKSAASQFIEQITRIAVVVAVYTAFGVRDIENACAVIVTGGVIGDFVSFAVQYALYCFDRRRYTEKRAANKLTLRMVNIAFPLALSAYARTALSTLQQLLIPAGFKKSGFSSEKALADYGTIHGMVLPVLTFPSAFFYALGEIIVPELTAAQVQGHKQTIERIVSRTLRISILIAFGLSAVLFRYGHNIGALFFESQDAGRYIQILSLIMPIMYLDSITDGLLRGLGQQLSSMWINIVDSVLSVILVYVLLPRWAVNGYLFIISFTELFNFILSIRRLLKVTKFHIKFRVVISSLFSSMGAVNIAMLILRNFRIPLTDTAASLAAHIILTLGVYFVILRIFNCIEEADIKEFRTMFTK